MKNLRKGIFLVCTFCICLSSLLLSSDVSKYELSCICSACENLSNQALSISNNIEDENNDPDYICCVNSLPIGCLIKLKDQDVITIKFNTKGSDVLKSVMNVDFWKDLFSESVLKQMFSRHNGWYCIGKSGHKESMYEIIKVLPKTKNPFVIVENDDNGKLKIVFPQQSIYNYSIKAVAKIYGNASVKTKTNWDSMCKMISDKKMIDGVEFKQFQFNSNVQYYFRSNGSLYRFPSNVQDALLRKGTRLLSNLIDDEKRKHFDSILKFLGSYPFINIFDFVYVFRERFLKDFARLCCVINYQGDLKEYNTSWIRSYALYNKMYDCIQGRKIGTYDKVIKDTFDKFVSIHDRFLINWRGLGNFRNENRGSTDITLYTKVGSEGCEYSFSELFNYWEYIFRIESCDNIMHSLIKNTTALDRLQQLLLTKKSSTLNLMMRQLTIDVCGGE